VSPFPDYKPAASDITELLVPFVLPLRLRDQLQNATIFARARLLLADVVLPGYLGTFRVASEEYGEQEHPASLSPPPTELPQELRYSTHRIAGKRTNRRLKRSLSPLAGLGEIRLTMFPRTHALG
jgi:hypothetical protein